jgi:hypothetical protein
MFSSNIDKIFLELKKTMSLELKKLLIWRKNKGTKKDQLEKLLLV